MATALVGTNLVAGRWEPGLEYTAVGKYTLAGAVVTGDTYTWTNLLPANGIQILDFRVNGVELDTNASPTATLIVGDATTTNGYLTSKTAGDANGQMQFFGDGAFMGLATGVTNATATRNVVGTVGGTVATAASSGDIYVYVRYYCTGTDA